MAKLPRALRATSPTRRKLGVLGNIGQPAPAAETELGGLHAPKSKHETCSTPHLRKRIHESPMSSSLRGSALFHADRIRSRHRFYRQPGFLKVLWYGVVSEQRRGQGLRQLRSSTGQTGRFIQGLKSIVTSRTVVARSGAVLNLITIF